MRYRDTGDYQNLGAPVDDILGVAFVTFGLRVKRYWLVIWGVGLILASLSYFVMRMLGYF